MIVVDGKAGPEYRVCGEPLFSQDSKHLAYWAKESDLTAKDGKAFVVVDGQPGPRYDDIMDMTVALSPDGKRVAYCAWKGESFFPVVDGNPRPEYKSNTAPVFSPDGKRVAYRAFDENVFRWLVVVDGQPGPDAFFFPRDPVFSRDSKHVACATQERMVVDNRPGPEYDEIFGRGPIFRENGVLDYFAVKKEVLYFVEHIPVGD